MQGASDVDGIADGEWAGHDFVFLRGAERFANALAARPQKTAIVLIGLTSDLDRDRVERPFGQELRTILRRLRSGPNGSRMVSVGGA
jgi:hypothetical protein